MDTGERFGKSQAPLPDFVWQAPVEPFGYTWQAGKHPRLGTDAQVLVAQQGAHFRAYSPLEDEPALVRIFADVDLVPGPMLAFADRYGRLGRPAAWPTPSIGQEVETDLDWIKYLIDLKFAVRLFDLIRAEDLAGLAEVIQWGSGGTVSCAFPIDDQEQAGLSEVPLGGHAWHTWSAEQCAQFHPGDLRAPAILWLCRSLSAMMAERFMLSPVLLWDGEKNEVRQEVRPYGLIGALYLQLAQALQDGIDFRRCAVCSKWFAIAPPATRHTRQTCSDACRMKLYRERQERARQLAGEGLKPAAIARELGSDVATVKGWIARGKEK